MSKPITVSLNGNTKTIEGCLSLQQALQLWGFADQKIATAINGDFVPRSRYLDTALNTDDKIDIVVPVGGG